MIQLNNIHKSFNDVEIIRDVDLSIGRGEVVTLIGRSGLGKTTLLRMINALEIPTEGTVLASGEAYTSKDKESQIEIYKQSSMIFQSYNLFPYKTALENVVEGLIIAKKLKKTEARGEFLELFEKVCLTHVKDQRPHTLSGGQQQCVVIARALAMNSKVILLGGPASALDPELVNDVLEVVKDLTNGGMTMVIVAYEMCFAEEVSSNIVFIHEGVVGEQGTPEEILNDPKTEELKRFLNVINEE